MSSNLKNQRTVELEGAVSGVKSNSDVISQPLLISKPWVEIFLV